MKSHPMTAAVLLIATAAVVGGLTYAKRNRDAEPAAIDRLARATIGLCEAVAIAESQSGGKAVEAELESARGAVFYEIEVVTTDSRLIEFRIDAADGRVLPGGTGTAGHDAVGNDPDDAKDDD